MWVLYIYKLEAEEKNNNEEEEVVSGGNFCVVACY